MDKDIKREFEKLNKRFDGVDKRLDGVDNRFNGMDKRFEVMATKEDLKAFATKDDLKESLKAQTKELKAFAVEQTEELARIVNGGFDDILERIDVRERVSKVEKKMMKIEHALHLEIEV